MNYSPRKRSFCQSLLFGGTIATLATGSILTPALSSSVKSNLEDSPKAVVDQVWQIVNNEFVDKEFNHADWQAKRQELLSRNYTNRKQAYKAIRDSLKELGDPYTRFLTPDEFEILTSHTSGEMSGVGLRLTLDKRTNDLVVVDCLKNSPAMKGGIKAGDRILKINGKPTALMNLEQASDEIQGEIGTEISLQVSRQGKKVFELTLTRTQVEIASVSYSLNQEDKLKVGYIKLDEFSSHATEQMKEAIKDLNKQGASAFVLDLRGNPGGLLFASVEIARLWMDQGAIVRTVDRKGGDQKFSANGTSITKLPLVVLVNEGSASASEILTGALKENGRATIVGTSTFGKGSVQSVHSLSDGSGIAVTIAHYYPPSGINITKKGIKPDIYLDLTMEQQLRLKDNPSLVATKADPQYARALSVLKTNNLTNTNRLSQPVGISSQF